MSSPAASRARPAPLRLPERLPTAADAAARAAAAERRRRRRHFARRRRDLVTDATAGLILAIVLILVTAGLGVLALLLVPLVAGLLAATVIERRRATHRH